MKKTSKKLTLSRETLRLLSAPHLSAAAGGSGPSYWTGACVECGNGGYTGSVPTRGEVTCNTIDNTACTTHDE